MLSHLFKFRNILVSFNHIKSPYKMSRQAEKIFKITKPSVNSLPKVDLTSCKSKKTCFKFQVLDTPIKSESDKKEYKVIRLRNGLTACLISDKSTVEYSSDLESESESDSESDESVSGEESENSDYKDHGDVEQKMAATGLCVGVGSFSDPKEVPGMAHFLEHMVFMGSEKFPEENDFDSFIKKGGGSDNASTDAETTCFYFECLEKHLHSALDKFAQFFIAPLMKKSAMTREREAIESEFQIALPSDSSRKEQLFCSFANPHSPVNSFTWGNLKTLRDNISDDELYDGVHKFRIRHYSAHRMTLAIQARLPMETLQEYVLESFCNVPNNELPPHDLTQYGEGVFDTPDFTRIYYINPTKDLRQLELTWSLHSLRDKYKSKPHQYLSYLLGDEGKGSLLSYLRKKVWGLSTSVGNSESGIEHNSMYSLFTISVNLTEEGQAHIFEVIEAIFSYINMLKRIGPQRRIFDEIKSISDSSFRFATEDTAVDIVEDLCESMQFYPPRDYIAGSELYYEYDPEAIKTITENLDPEKMNIMVTSKTLPDGLKYNKVEKWFGTEYTDTEIPKAWVTRWKNVSPYAELDVPLHNPYLTTDFSILPESKSHPDYPQKIMETPLLEMWYRKDQKFKLPLAYYCFYLISPVALESPSRHAMMDIIMNLLVVSVTEELYPARNAELSHSFTTYEKGLIIKVSGYNEKLALVVDVISKYLVTFAEQISNNMFEAVKDKVIKHYYNKLLKPGSLAKCKKLYEEYISSLYVKALVQGNVSKETATETVSGFVRNVGFAQLPENSYPRFRVVQVPNGEKCCRLQGFNKNDSNSIIANYYQSGPFSIRSSVIIEIIMLLIEEPLFDILRTKEQLGYHVYCSIRDTFGILGYTLTVNTQATKYTSSYIDGRIEEFLKHTQKLLADLTEEELEQTKEDLIKTKLCVDVHLKEEVDRNWAEIISDDYIFDRIKQEVEAINNVKIGEIREWWDKHNVFGSQENFRKISIQVVGNDEKNKGKISPIETGVTSGEVCGDSLNEVKITLLGSDEDGKAENKPENYFIQNVEAFKENLFLYPAAHKN
ncbi:hypothetical protein NQ317_008950 [Molorchus minor]|uniref:Nardilysin n=1 Tax=Molorchus minor TaxID=1323400 RepID=A0ABQ9K0G5_9CUCU|nr:hypothetical protein NQ317_008950 [Molorchus minor]